VIVHIYTTGIPLLTSNSVDMSLLGFRWSWSRAMIQSLQGDEDKLFPRCLESERCTGEGVVGEEEGEGGWKSVACADCMAAPREEGEEG
jgi:hypothetical protein